MKNDMEYSAVQEYTTLPDEYLQGGGAVLPEEKNGNVVWKKMMYMTAALAVMAYTAVGAFASPDTPDSTQTDNPPLLTEESYNPPKSEIPELPENLPEEQPTEQEPSEETVEEPVKNTVLEAVMYYPAEDVTSYLTVYNDSFDSASRDNKVLMNDFVFESLFLQGYSYDMPPHEPVDGYVFMGWTVYYDKEVSSGPLLGMLGDSLNPYNICYIKPDFGSGSSRSIEIHAAWRHDGIGDYPYLLVLDANGGTIEKKSSMTYDAKGPMGSATNVYLCAYPTPEREGYTFTGWYTEADGGDGTTRLLGMDFYEKNGNEYDWSHTKTITLYAGWEKE